MLSYAELEGRIKELEARIGQADGDDVRLQVDLQDASSGRGVGGGLALVLLARDEPVHGFVEVFVDAGQKCAVGRVWRPGGQVVAHLAQEGEGFSVALVGAEFHVLPHELAGLEAGEGASLRAGLCGLRPEPLRVSAIRLQSLALPPCRAVAC